ncbi:hypothetical protein WA158_002675 [Blastocystis sp. Blastoise]
MDTNKNDEMSLINLLKALDTYQPSIPEEVTSYLLNQSGCNLDDSRLVKMVSLSAQRFLAEIVTDAMSLNKLTNIQDDPDSETEPTLTLSQVTQILERKGMNTTKLSMTQKPKQ